MINMIEAKSIVMQKLKLNKSMSQYHRLIKTFESTQNKIDSLTYWNVHKFLNLLVKWVGEYNQSPDEVRYHTHATQQTNLTIW